MERVEVEWEDAATATSGWTSREDMTKEVGLSHIVTIGYVFRETRRFLTLVQSQANGDGNVMHDISIPKGWITKRKVLR